MDVIELPTFDNTIGFETLTVAGTVGTLSASEYIDGFKDARAALITLDGTAGTNDIRFTTDGTDPVATTTGHKLVAGKTLIIRGFGNISKFKAIREGGTSGVIQVSYYR